MDREAINECIEALGNAMSCLAYAENSSDELLDIEEGIEELRTRLSAMLNRKGK